jgi:basic membrane protein A
VLQGINAFTLGMRSVDPKAQVKVVWLNAWFDPGKERDAAMALMTRAPTCWRSTPHPPR